MDAVSYSLASKQAQRIEKFIENPDSTSGIVTVPKVIASGETITIPAGRIAVLPNVQVDGVINIEGEVFVPSGSTYGDRVMYEKINYIATQGQTVFSVNYDLGSVDVYVNGIRLASTDFVATSLTSVTIPGGLNAGDIVELVSFGAFTVVDTYTKAETDNKLGFKANTADLKEIGVNQSVQTFTVGTQRVAGSNYSNSTGKPIWIIVGMTAGAGATLSITAGGALRVFSVPDNGSQTRVIVPILNGETYSATASVGTINYWAEIR